MMIIWLTRATATWLIRKDHESDGAVDSPPLEWATSWPLQSEVPREQAQAQIERDEARDHLPWDESVLIPAHLQQLS